jgi:hypothetical protein
LSSYQLSNYFDQKTIEEEESIIFPLFMSLATIAFVGFFADWVYLDYDFTKKCRGNLERLTPFPL